MVYGGVEGQSLPLTCGKSDLVVKGRNDGLRSSPFLKSTDGQQWLERSILSSAVLSGILRIMHPQQYRAGVEALQRLHHYPNAPSELQRWPSIFNAITIISSRHCPMHRDTGGDFHMYDILASIGDYTSARMCLMPLGIQISNSPGTVVGYSGLAIRHGVAPADGPRVCHALYMRSSLQEYTGVRPCGWMQQECYRRWIGDTPLVHSLHLDPFCI